MWQCPFAVASAPSLEPGYFCDPCHELAENQLFGVGDMPGGLVAVGVQQPPAEAVAFASSDGRRRVPLSGFSGATTTMAIAVASAGTRTVIVGLEHRLAAAWASDAAEASRPSMHHRVGYRDLSDPDGIHDAGTGPTGSNPLARTSPITRCVRNRCSRAATSPSSHELRHPAPPGCWARSAPRADNVADRRSVVIGRMADQALDQAPAPRSMPAPDRG